MPQPVCPVQQIVSICPTSPLDIVQYTVIFLQMFVKSNNKAINVGNRKLQTRQMVCNIQLHALRLDVNHGGDGRQGHQDDLFLSDDVVSFL